MSSLDADLSMFMSYAKHVKFLMHGFFQSVMYRMYRLNRADMSQFRDALQMQAFSKESSSLFGYVFKVFAINQKKSSNHKKTLNSIKHIMTKEEFLQALKEACIFWKNLNDIF